MHHRYRSMKMRLKTGPLAAAFSLLLLAGVAVTPGCGEVNIETKGYKEFKSKMKAELKEEVRAELQLESGTAQAPVVSSSCVSCHTDKERLKMETAGIKAPPTSAMQSGKG